MNFFSFQLKNLADQVVSFDTFKKSKCFLVVNVASQCGLTKSNYEALTKIYDKYQAQGLEILAFPCNQFGSQEPWEACKISDFVRDKYAVKFQVFSKIDVNGPNTSDFYKFLKQSDAFKTENPKVAKNGATEDIPWNFAKFLLNRNGEVIKYYGPRVEPTEILPDIEAELNK